MFETGTVLEVDGDQLVIEFKTVGVKRIPEQLRRPTPPLTLQAGGLVSVH